MDTLGNLARVEGFLANLEWNGKTVKKNENIIFKALIAAADSLDPNLDLGADPREYMTMDVLKPTPNLAAQDIVLMVEDNQEIKVVKRLDNPADPFIRFYAVKVTDKDS